jgi:Protein of unknown function (DUF1097)
MNTNENNDTSITRKATQATGPSSASRHLLARPRVAAAIAAAVFAGVSVWGFAQTKDLLIWAAFIGWASYDANGAGRRAAVFSTGSLLFGVVMAWLVALTVADGLVPFGSDLSSAVAAAVASLLIVLASAVPLVSSVPSTFCGFASTFAFLTLVAGADTTGKLTSLGWGNAGIAVAVSLVIGTGLGIAHGELARLMTVLTGERRALKPRLRLDGASVSPNQAVVAQSSSSTQSSNDKPRSSQHVL